MSTGNDACYVSDPRYKEVFVGRDTGNVRMEIHHYAGNTICCGDIGSCEEITHPEAEEIFSLFFFCFSNFFTQLLTRFPPDHSAVLYFKQL